MKIALLKPTHALPANVKQVGAPVISGPARPTKLLNQLRRDLVAHYKAGHKHAAKCLSEKQLAEVHVWLAGKAALEARRALPADQEFGQWVESCGDEVSRQTIYRWMQMVEAFQDQVPLLTTISTGGCQQRVMKLLAGEIAKATDGKTRRQLELDLGLRSAGGKQKRKLLCFRCKKEITDKVKTCPHCGHDPRTTEVEERETAVTSRVLKLESELQCVGSWPLSEELGTRLVKSLITTLADLNVLTKEGELTLDGEIVTKDTVKHWRAVEEAKRNL